MSTTATAPQPPEASNPFDDAPIVHRYTRADGLRDGLLVDVTETGREAGFKVPVAITAAVQDQCVRWTDEDARGRPRIHQDEDGRLWDVLWMAACRSREIARSGRHASVALIDEAETEGHDVKVVLNDEVGRLMEAHGYVSFHPKAAR